MTMSHNGPSCDPATNGVHSDLQFAPIAGLADRLAGAIDHLDRERKSWIRQQMLERNITGGIKAGIAALAGLPGQSTLSDMLSGRIQGRRYLASLAEVLQVDLAWLQGDERTAPDWALSPLAAFERWAAQLRAVAQRRIPNPSRPQPKDDIDSGLAAVDTTPIAALAPQLGLTPGHPAVGHILAGNYALVPFDALLSFAALLGLPAPGDPAHVRAGQQDASEVEHRVQQAVHHERERMRRYLIPPQLFAQMRRILLDARQRGMATTRVCEDALECLWRQHLRDLDKSKRHLPDGFRRDTGRTQWTGLEQLRERYRDDS
jgi:hypothetical protein